MRLLSDVEKAAAAADVRELITSSGQTATLLRKQTGENLYGSDEGDFVEVCTFPLELSETPPKTWQSRRMRSQVFCLSLMFAWRTVFVLKVETFGCRPSRHSCCSES